MCDKKGPEDKRVARLGSPVPAPAAFTASALPVSETGKEESERAKLQFHKVLETIPTSAHGHAIKSPGTKALFIEYYLCLYISAFQT